MNKKIFLILCFVSLLCGCASNIENVEDQINDEKNIIHDISEYYTADDKIDCQKFIDDNIIVEGKPSQKGSGINVKLIIKNNSDFYINGLPFKIIMTNYHNAELPSNDLFLFLRPYDEICYYFTENTSSKFGITSKPIGYKNVISKQESPNLAYANDLTMKINNQSEQNKSIFNVTFINKLNTPIVEKAPFFSMCFYCDELYINVSLNHVAPGHNQNDIVNKLPLANDLIFNPGENNYTANISSCNESIVFVFYGKPNNQFLEETKNYSEYNNLRNAFYNCIYA